VLVEAEETNLQIVLLVIGGQAGLTASVRGTSLGLLL
jgi:hypothetical protein